MLGSDAAFPDSSITPLVIFLSWIPKMLKNNLSNSFFVKSQRKSVNLILKLTSIRSVFGVLISFLFFTYYFYFFQLLHRPTETQKRADDRRRSENEIAGGASTLTALSPLSSGEWATRRLVTWQSAAIGRSSDQRQSPLFAQTINHYLKVCQSKIDTIKGTKIGANQVKSNQQTEQSAGHQGKNSSSCRHNPPPTTFFVSSRLGPSSLSAW